MRYYECPTELEAMRLFYNEIGYPEGTVDYSCNTDGRLILDKRIGLMGSLIEFKIIAKNNKDVFEQMKRYIKAYNSKGLSLPKYGVYIITAQQKFTVFDLEATSFDNAVIQENLNLTVNLDNFTCSADPYLKDTTTQKGWIDEDSIIAYNDKFFSTKGCIRKKKDDFIKELANPTLLNIIPYFWNETGEMERKFLDCIGSAALKKRLGAFFTPDYAVEKSTKYIRDIINNFNESEEYVIIDRCAGTGNLEKFLNEEELSHCILNTIVYAEKTTLKGLYEGRVKAILPEDETVDEDGCMIYGNALSESFNNNLKEKIEEIRIEAESRGKKLVVIMLENPPYSEPQAEATRSGETVKGTSKNYITEQMKLSGVKGSALNDMANKFIWSGFNLIKANYYVVYSPVKYFKSQNLVNKKLIEGILVNRKDFHATEAAISIMSWKNEDEVVNEWKLENATVKRIRNGITANNPISAETATIAKFAHTQGTPDYKHAILINTEANIHAKLYNLDVNNIKQALPLFAANCYDCKDYTEKEVIMKSGDGGITYQSDEEFLNDCFIWCCLTDKNKCISNKEIQNETALSQNSKSDLIINLRQPHRLNLKRSWDNVLNEAKKCEEYNSSYKYGLFQIEKDLNVNELTDIVDKKGNRLIQKRYPTLDTQIKSFKEDLKNFYDEYIEKKLFQYELLK